MATTDTQINNLIINKMSGDTFQALTDTEKAQVANQLIAVIEEGATLGDLEKMKNVITTTLKDYVNTTITAQSLIRHTITIRGIFSSGGSTIDTAVCFTVDLKTNVAIDSLQDMITYLASTDIACSGVVGGNPVTRIDIGATATAISFLVMSSTVVNISELSSITITDDVTTNQ